MKFGKYILSFLFLSVSVCMFGQAGQSVFSFLSLPYSARHNAHGGENVSLGLDGDISFALNNPALLSSMTHNSLSMSYAYYGSAMNFAGVAYGHNWGDNYGGVAVHYLDYGKFKYSDEYGALSGTTFSARDFLVDIIYARQLGPMFRVGAALKPVYSAYESYHSFALGADVGGYFMLPDSTLQIGLTLQNIGWQLKGFYSEESGQKLDMMPLNLQMGISYKLKHAPLRFSMTIHNMQRWNLNYGMQTVTPVKWYDMMFRHTVWAVDIIPKKDVFWLTLSYNHRRRMEMQLKEQRSLAGFALGVGLHIKSVRVGFALSQYTRSNFTYQATLALDINEYIK
ncbi:MAG: type IX secretion system protein PorQ [Paludibacteraceae bacterium]|nr:type IX secretion system protein PorQ [Paludibacteraceae bacterium]